MKTLYETYFQTQRAKLITKHNELKKLRELRADRIAKIKDLLAKFKKDPNKSAHELFFEKSKKEEERLRAAMLKIGKQIKSNRELQKKLLKYGKRAGIVGVVGAVALAGTAKYIEKKEREEEAKRNYPKGTVN